MPQPITLLGACLCLAILYLRYRSQHMYRDQLKDRPRRTLQEKLKTAKIFLAAFLAWMTLSYTLQHMIFRLDGAPAPEPSLMERIVFYFSK